MDVVVLLWHISVVRVVFDGGIRFPGWQAKRKEKNGRKPMFFHTLALGKEEGLICAALPPFRLSSNGRGSARPVQLLAKRRLLLG
jgi:hypothetical protein